MKGNESQELPVRRCETGQTMGRDSIEAEEVQPIVTAHPCNALAKFPMKSITHTMYFINQSKS